MAESNTFIEMEEKIMKCWGVIEDLETTCQGVMDHNWSEDDIANALIGMRTIYNLRFDQLMTCFETLLRENAELRSKTE